MLYYGGYLTIKNLVGESTVVLGPPNLTVYQNLLTMFNNVHHFIALNKELNSYCNDSVPVTEDTWKNCLIELSIIQAGLHLLSTK